MKEGLHPEYKNSKVTCACGAVIETRSTRGDFHIEICSSCHPFFTGKQKILDTAGRIERFKNRYANSPKGEEKAAPPPAPVPVKAAAKTDNRALKRAKANAGKPKPAPKPEAEAAPAPASETPEA